MMPPSQLELMLHKEFLENLPEYHKELITEIEAAAGFELELLNNSKVIEKYPGIVDIEDSNLGLVPGSTFAVICVPEGQIADADALFHELLHARRIYVDKVPMFRAKRGGQLDAAIIDQDNDIEHFFFLQNEFAVVPTAKQYWAERYAEWWRTWRRIDNPFQAITTFHAYATMRRHLPAIREKVDYKLEKSGLDPAQFRVISDVLLGKPDKLDYVCSLLDIAKFPRAQLYFRIYNPSTASFDHFDLPGTNRAAPSHESPSIQ